MPRVDSPLVETPILERALVRLRSKIVTLVLIHGLGTVLAVTSVWLVFAFLADWGLHVPRPIRLIHSLVVVLLPAYFLWRELIRPLGRIPNRPGLALLLEREDTSLHELLVSAAELQGKDSFRNGDPHLIAKLCREADERAAKLTSGAALDRRKPALRMFAGLSCSGVTAALLLISPLHAEIFFSRLIGRDVAWPQRTQLVVELPNQPDVVRVGNTIVVRSAHGSDIPILIRARGITPEKVTLHLGDGTKKDLPQGSGSSFRTVLHSLTRDLEFHVTGGDDRDEYPLVQIHVLQPPDVAGIAVRTSPPAYTGLQQQIDFNRDVEVLAGSLIEVYLLPDPLDAHGIARILPENRTLELLPAEFPIDPVLQAASEGVPLQSQPGLSFRIEAERSIRYRFELTDDTGLANPDPGLYGITVIEDTTPEVLIHAPGRSEVETVAGGAIPVRVLATDDFGLVSMWWSSTEAGQEASERRGSMTLLSTIESALQAEHTASDGVPPLAARSHMRLDASELAGAESPAEGARFTLEIQAFDNRQPEANIGRSTPIRIRIVSSDELMRRVRDRLTRVRTQAEKLSLLQTEKRRRVEELMEGLVSDEFDEAGDIRALSSVLNGERLAQGDASSLTRELAAVVETILYARLDEQAGALFEALDSRMSGASSRGFQSEIWQTLVDDYKLGSLGSAGLAGNLTDILGVALSISEVHTRNASSALERAQDADNMRSLRGELETAGREQGLALERIEDLLERLAEWDSFQSVLALTRDILDRQSTLRQRTQRFATEK